MAGHLFHIISSILVRRWGPPHATNQQSNNPIPMSRQTPPTIPHLQPHTPIFPADKTPPSPQASFCSGTSGGGASTLPRWDVCGPVYVFADIVVVRCSGIDVGWLQSSCRSWLLHPGDDTTMPVQETKEKVASGGNSVCLRARSMRRQLPWRCRALWEGRGGGGYMVPGGGGGVSVSGLSSQWWGWLAVVVVECLFEAGHQHRPLLRKGAVETRLGHDIEARRHQSFNAAESGSTAATTATTAGGGVEELERRKHLAERWGRSTLLACPCFSPSLADPSVKGRYKDGSERNAGLAGFSVLNTSGPGEVGPEVGDRPAGVPVGGAERSAGGVWSWHRACCSCWALRWWEGSSWRAAARGGGGSQEEEEAVPFRGGVTGRKGTEKTREAVENWGGCRP